MATLASGRRDFRVLEAGGIERAAHQRRISWRLPMSPVAILSAAARPFGTATEMPVCWKWPGSTRAPGSFGSKPANESCDSAKASPCPLRRHLGHQIDARHFLDRGIRRGAARAARGGRVGNGDDAHAGPVDLVDGLNFGAGRHQIGAGNEIIGRAEIDLALARRDRAA